MKAAARHAGNSRWQRDEGTNHRQEAGDENGEVSPAREEAVGPIEFTSSHENPAAVALDEWTSTISAKFIRDKRPQVATDRAGSGDPEEIESALKDEVSGKRHDQFRGQRNARGLDGHEDRDTDVA